MVKKSFFREPSKAAIKKRDAVTSRGNPVQELVDLKENQYLVCASPIAKTRFADEPLTWLKHGAEIPIHGYRSIEEAIEDSTIPLDLRRVAYGKNRARRLDFACYSFVPLIGGGRERRRVCPVQVLDGTMIFGFSESLRKGFVEQARNVFYEDVKLPGIKVKPYDAARGVEKDGAQIVVLVPSSVEGRDRYKMTITGIPVASNPKAFAIAHSFGSDHTCEFKRYRSLRYPHLNHSETARAFNVCKHEVAAQRAIIDFYANSRGNIIPLTMSPIALPSKLLVEVYKRMLDSLLIYDDGLASEDKLRKPNQADKQAFLDRAVKLFGHDETLFASSKRDGLISDYDWRLRT